MAEKPDIAGMLADPDFKALPQDMQAQVIERVTGSQPQVEMEKSVPGELYHAGEVVGKALPEIAPAAAAVGAGALSGPWAPVTAPLAYGATEGLLNPKEIQEHPVREGLAAASMAIPGPAEAVGYTFPKFAVEHPVAMRGVGALGGALAGESLGKEYGGNYGMYGGPVAGALIGYGLGGKLVSAEGEKLIDDVLAGRRPLSELPPQLADKFLSKEARISRLAMERAARSGEPIDTVNIPVGSRKIVTREMEKRARMATPEPTLIVTPEKEAQQQQLDRAYEVATQDLYHKGRFKGMAHAAGEHHVEYVPGSEKFTVQKGQTFKIRPRAALPIVPPK